MSHIDIVSLPLSGDNKERLALDLVGIFTRMANCPPGAVHIRFHPVDRKDYFVGGHNGSLELSEQPDAHADFSIKVAWYRGRSSQTQEDIAKAVTDSAVSLLSLPPEKVEIGFSEYEPSSHFEGRIRTPSP